VNRAPALTPAQKEALDVEAQRRVRRALHAIEEAQNQLNSACQILSSLRYAAPQWKSTSRMADKVKAHWYRVRDALEFSAKARRVALDPLNADALLAALAKHQQQAQP
jgi:hypothetical protein